MNKAIITIVVVIVIIVVGVLLFGINENGTDTNTDTGNTRDVLTTQEDITAETVDTQGVETQQGIVVSVPLPGELVSLPVEVQGFVNGNGWFANEGEVGTVELVDANGRSLGEAILPATTNWLELPTEFETTVSDRQWISFLETDTGELIFRNRRDREDDVALEHIVPVRLR